jgi:hypothetical protein
MSVATKQAETPHDFMDPAKAKKLLAESKTASLLAADAPTAVPHPGLNGFRVMSEEPRPPAVYFVWNGGFKCHIPDPATYDSLFANWDRVLRLDVDELNSISTGPPMSPGAAIVQAAGDTAVYLVSNGSKHWVTRPFVMRYCNFRAPLEVPRSVLEPIPRGFDINYGD